MSVCRKCGGLTESPIGLQHVPHPSQVARSSEWLIAQSRLLQIEKLRQLRAT